MSGAREDAGRPAVGGERGAGVASVAEEGGGLGRGLAAALISVVGAGLLYLTFHRDRPQPSGAADGRRAAISQAAPFTPAATPRKTPAPPPEPPPAPDDAMLEAGARAPVIAYSSNAGRTRRDRDGAGKDGENHGKEDPAGSALQNSLRPTRLEGVRAGVLPDLHMIAPQGSIIPCVLQTAISSDQPGFVSCVIPRDVLSASGQVVLMEKGTVVAGECGGGLRRGQRRIFVLWNRARTPRGVVVDLASPAADGLGRAGFDGEIDTHFWERFGGALLMSIVSDASSYGFDRLRDGAGIDIGTANGASATALGRSIDIPPTLYKNQGEAVSIFVARDLDFSGVYDLRMTGRRNRREDGRP